MTTDPLSSLRSRLNGSSSSPFIIASALDVKHGHPTDALDAERVAKAKHCVDLGVQAGVKAAAWAAVGAAVPTLVAVRTVPWAKANLNYTAQALIICGSSIAAYFVTSEQTILECTRSTSRKEIEAKRAAAGQSV